MEKDKILARDNRITFNKKMKKNELSRISQMKYDIAVRRVIELSRKNIRVTGQYTAGGSFGEKALLSKDSRRGATIKAITDCYLGVLSKDTYDLTIGKIQKNQVEDLIEFLRTLPLFHRWTRNGLGNLYYFFKKETFFKNELVYQQDSKCDKIYIVFDGEFQQDIR